MGAVDGGVWKSTDYGVTWTNITDRRLPGTSDSIGAIAVAASDPNLIYVGQLICIPHIEPVGTAAVSPASAVAPQTRNLFPYGSCTWWANQRYYQLHGVFVPWTTNAMAWQWTARAIQYGWHVSSLPTPGAIIDLQPWVQGAYGWGHVGVVEKVLSGNRVIASSMNWGAHPNRITYWSFTPGRGVTFITQ